VDRQKGLSPAHPSTLVVNEQLLDPAPDPWRDGGASLLVRLEPTCGANASRDRLDRDGRRPYPDVLRRDGVDADHARFRPPHPDRGEVHAADGALPRLVLHHGRMHAALIDDAVAVEIGGSKAFSTGWGALRCRPGALGGRC